MLYTRTAGDRGAGCWRFAVAQPPDSGFSDDLRQRVAGLARAPARPTP